MGKEVGAAAFNRKQKQAGTGASAKRQVCICIYENAPYYAKDKADKKINERHCFETLMLCAENAPNAT